MNDDLWLELSATPAEADCPEQEGQMSEPDISQTPTDSQPQENA